MDLRVLSGAAEAPLLPGTGIQLSICSSGRRMRLNCNRKTFKWLTVCSKLNLTFRWLLNWRNGRPNRISIATQSIKCGTVHPTNYKEWVAGITTLVQTALGREDQVLVVSTAIENRLLLIIEGPKNDWSWNLLYRETKGAWIILTQASWQVQGRSSRKGNPLNLSSTNESLLLDLVSGVASLMHSK